MIAIMGLMTEMSAYTITASLLTSACVYFYEVKS